MDGVALVSRHFPEFSSTQLNRLSLYVDALLEANAHVNLISRKDTDEVWERHILHSLSIAKAVSFADGSLVADVGTGGGLPGIPLAIAFPKVQFVLIDSIGKKIKAVEQMVRQVGLANVSVLNTRMESVNRQFDFVVSRAVSALPDMSAWLRGKIKDGNASSLPNGLVYIKGGDFQNELDSIGKAHRVWEINQWFSSAFFDTKKVVWLDLAR